MPLPNPAVVFTVVPNDEPARLATFELLAAGFSQDQFEVTGPDDLADLEAAQGDGGSRLLSAIARFRPASRPDSGVLSERLLDLGATEAEAHYYEEQGRGGQRLITVTGIRRGSEAACILGRHGNVLAVAPADTPAATTVGVDVAVVQEDVRAASVGLSHSR
jgi:hypothetical protein